jgi:hypothetical protein
MNQEVKEKWVAALRSGNYTQGTTVLRGPGNRFCCLGVLCDLAVKAGVIKDPVSPTRHIVYGKFTNTYYYAGNTQVLPDAVTEWAGLSSPNGYIKTIRRSLGSLNDSGTSFDKIADLIEEHL